MTTFPPILNEFKIMLASKTALNSFKSLFPEKLVTNKSLSQRFYWFFNHAKEIKVKCNRTNLRRFVFEDIEFRIRGEMIIAVRKYIAPPPPPAPRTPCTYSISRHALERFTERHPTLVGNNSIHSMEDLLMNSVEYKGFINDTARVSQMIEKYGDLPMIRINGKVTFVIKNNFVLTTLINF